MCVCGGGGGGGAGHGGQFGKVYQKFGERTILYGRPISYHSEILEWPGKSGKIKFRIARESFNCRVYLFTIYL